MAEICLRWALLVFSWWGYSRLIARWGKLRVEFTPFFLFGAQTLAVYLAGVSGLPYAMPIVSAVMLWGGVLAIPISFLPKLRASGSRQSSWLLLFAALAAWGVYALYGQKLLHFDNFTHWGVIVKLLLQNDRLPTAADALIRFQSYPPGSACFLYYVCRATSSAEWCAIYAQALLLFSCVITLGAFVPEKARISACIVAVFAFAGVAFLFQIYELLVDDLLSLCAVACTAMLLAGAKDGELPPPVPMGIALGVMALIKNSGLFFGLFILAYAFIALRRKKGFGKWLLISAGIPVLAFALWRAHVALAFPEGLVTKHAMSLSNYARILEYKTWDDTIKVFVKFAGRTLRKVRVLCVLGVSFAAWLYARRRKMALTDGVRWMPIYMLGCYAVYMLGMFLMYIASMPASEALILGGFDRYHETIELYLVGMAVVYAVSWLSAFSANYSENARRSALSAKYSFDMRRSASCVALAFLLLWCGFADCSPKKLLRREITGAEDRVRLEALVDQIKPDATGAVLICHSDGQSSLLSACGRYLLGTADVRAELAPTADWLEENLYDFGVILLLDPGDETDVFLRKHGYDPSAQVLYTRDM